MAPVGTSTVTVCCVRMCFTPATLLSVKTCLPCSSRRSLPSDFLTLTSFALPSRKKALFR
ncbi:hypothetical protein D3C83_114790 [compost metagenome]